MTTTHKGKLTYVKEELCKAYLDLLSEKKYADISISDIVRKAQVARASFYRYFSSTSEILDLITETFAESLIQNIIPILLEGDETKIRELLHFHLDAYLNQGNRFQAIDPVNMSILISRTSQLLLNHPFDTLGLSTEQKYRIPAKFGIIINVLSYWRGTGEIESEEEIISCIVKLLAAV